MFDYKKRKSSAYKHIGNYAFYKSKIAILIYVKIPLKGKMVIKYVSGWIGMQANKFRYQTELT